jgi:hypothetical protein
MESLPSFSARNFPYFHWLFTLKKFTPSLGPTGKFRLHNPDQTPDPSLFTSDPNLCRQARDLPSYHSSTDKVVQYTV